MKKHNKVSLKKRFDRSVQDAKRMGGGGSQIFDWSKTKVNEIKFYNVKKYGRHKLIILPFWIKSKNNPIVKTGEFEVGEPDYLFEYYSHKGLGPSHDKRVICLNKMYGKSCPICNLRDELIKEGKKKEADNLRPQQLAIYNVYDANDMDAGLQILEVSYSLFQKKMVREASDYDDGEAVIIGEPDDLKVVKFKSFEQSFAGSKYPDFESFSFEDCEEDIDPDIIDKTISFDEAMKIPTTEEVEKLLYGDDLVEEDNENEDDDKEENEEDQEEDDEEQDEELEDNDEDDDEEEEEKPVKKNKSKSKSSIKCPEGHTFGKDCNKYDDDCDECDLWEECLKEKNRLKKLK